MTGALLLLAALPGFVFEDLNAWKYVEGRQEFIPALQATLRNETGQDWREAQFRVRVHCVQGGERTYTVRLRELERGSKAVSETAFDSIGRLPYCEGAAEVEFVQGTPVPPAEVASYAVLGFSYGSPPDPLLEGILDYRRISDSRIETQARFLQGGGQMLWQANGEGVAYYAFRVPPGRMGLAGFLRSSDPQSSIPANFLRFFDIPPDSAAFLGRFHVEQTPSGLVSVIVDPDAEGWERVQRELPSLHGRTWVRPQILRQGLPAMVAREP